MKYPLLDELLEGNLDFETELAILEYMNELQSRGDESFLTAIEQENMESGDTYKQD